MVNNTENVKGVVENQILSKIIQNKSTYLIDKYELSEADFDTPLYNENREMVCNTRDVFKYIKDHFDKYKSVPDESTLLSNFPDFVVVDVNESDDYLISTLKTKTNDKNFASLLMTAKKLHLDKGSKEAALFIERSLANYLDIPIQDVGIDLVHEGADERLQAYEKANLDPTSTFISCGLKEIDEVTGGLCRKEELVFVQARTGNAKTFLLLKMLFEAWNNGETVGIYSPELSSNLMGYRFDSYIAQISNFKLRRGLLLDKNYKTHIQELKQRQNKFFLFTRKDFNGYPTVSKFRAICKKKGITVLGIDGFQREFLCDERATRESREDQILSDIAYDLMDMSRDMNIPIIAAIQSQRVDKDTELDVNTVKGGYAVSQACSLMFTLVTEQRKSTVKIVKNRNGEVGKSWNYQVDLDKGCWSFEGSEVSNKSYNPRNKESSQVSTRQKTEDSGNMFEATNTDIV